MTATRRSTDGHVCLLHFEPGLAVTANRVARHYLDFAERDVDARVAQHLHRQGSPLVAAVIAAGGDVTLLADPRVCRPRWRYRGGWLYGDALAPADHHPDLIGPNRASDPAHPSR